MSAKYEVAAVFTITNNKPQLSSISLYSSSKVVPYLVGSEFSMLAHSRFFKTQKEAQGYINYLYSKYPYYTAPLPVLDSGQNILFQELSK